MTRAGLTPDVISYTSLIKAWAATGGAGAARADEIFHEMQQRTNHFSTFTPPTSYTYAHLMNVHERAGSAPDLITQLLADMISHHLDPAATHYLIALRAAAAHGLL